MAPYSDSVSVVNSPLSGDSNEYDWDELSNLAYESHRQVQKRMIIIMVAVLFVVAGMAMFVLPQQSPLVVAGVQPVAAAADVAAPAVAAEPATEAAAEAAAIQNSAAESPGGIAPLFTPEVQYWENEIVAWAAEHDLDPNILATIMQIESCGNPQAVSVAGARGLFQVMPFHFSGGEDMLDPDTNARRGMNFYNEQLRYTGGDKLLSFAGYNGGYAASGGDFATWPNETKRYYEWAKGIYADAKQGAGQSATLDAWLAAGGGPGCEIAARTLGLR